MQPTARPFRTSWRTVSRLVSSGARPLPTQPRAERPSHDQLLVAGRQPRQLLGEQRHALTPRARHPRDVGAPEHPVGAEGIVDLPEVAVDVAERIGLARVARRSRRLDGDVRMLREREHVGQGRPRRAVLHRGRRSSEVIDDQPEPRMSLRDLADLREEAGCEQRDGKPGALGRRPQPVDRAVGRPRLLMRLQEGEAQAQHPGPALPAVDQAATLGPIEREISQDREPVGMLAVRLDRLLVGVRIPRGRRMDHCRVDARVVHLLQQLVLREGRHLPVMGIRRLAARPDVDLRIDDLHRLLLTRQYRWPPVSLTQLIRRLLNHPRAIAQVVHDPAQYVQLHTSGVVYFDPIWRIRYRLWAKKLITAFSKVTSLRARNPTNFVPELFWIQRM